MCATNTKTNQYHHTLWKHCKRNRQSLKQDYGSGHGKGKALCMETYKNFFHSYRMPHEDMDRLLPQSRRSNHIVVASCNQFYILRLGQDPLDNPYRREAQNQLNEASIFDQLLRIYRVSREQAKRQLASNQKSGSTWTTPRVGLLTTENRKTWARWHKKLSHCCTADAPCRSNLGGGSSSPNTNTESLRQIEDCLFVMCLDSMVSNGQRQQHSSGYKMGEEISDVEAANLILTGGGTHLFTGNRWFDKFLQIIVGRNGICGINIEHSASEGITVLRFLEEFLDFIRSNPIESRTSNTNGEQTLAGNLSDESKRFHYKPQVAGQSITSPSYVEPKSPSALLEESDKITTLMWQVDDELQTAIDEAEKSVNRLIENFSLYILDFKQFGRTFIKRQNLSPDAFVQLALQYTYYKLHGQLVSTYESASLRQFRLGRVDDIRANTCEAFQWIQSMLKCKKGANGQVSYAKAEKSFIKAITKQVEILRYTIIGGGPDNHLLALRELAKIRYGPDEPPELFTDQSYKEFLNFRLSTSQLPNESGIIVGYGAVVPDGYGCSYNPCKERIVFSISSFHDCPQTSSSRFAKTLEESLEEMRQLCSEMNAVAAMDKRRPSQV